MRFFSKLILCATPNHLLAGIWCFGRFQRLETFSDSEEGKALFKNFLSQFSNINTYLLVDVVEEDYRQEILPHVRGRDRRDLLARKLEQIYRKNLFRAAVFLNRETENYNSDRFLLVALNQSEHIDTWLEVINSQQIPLVGVYPLSILSALLLKNSHFSAPHILLCEHLNAGLRQTYLEDGSVVVSRLAPYPHSASLAANNVPLDFYLTETEKARFYLVSQRLVGQADELVLATTSSRPESQTLMDKIAVTQNMSGYIFSAEKIQKSLKIDASELRKYPELLYMTLLAKSNKGLLGNLAPQSLLKNYYINQIRRCLSLASLVIFFMAFLWSVVFVVEDQLTQQKIKKLSVATNIQQTKYEKVAKDFPYTPYPSDQLIRVINFYSTVQQYHQTPALAMQVISRAISKFPDIQINRIHWTQASDVNMRDAEELPHGQTPENKEPPPNFSKNTLHQVVYVSGEIRRFNGDYRGALQLVNQIVDNLKRDASVPYAVLLQAPVNTSSYSDLEGRTSDEVENKESTALFKIKLVMKSTEAIK